MISIFQEFFIWSPNGSPDTNPYSVGKTVKLFQSNGIENGQAIVTSVTNNSATVTDSSLRFTIIRARISSGSIVVGGNVAIKIGADISASSNFTDYTLTTDNTIEVAKLQSTAGTALLKLGRVDGIASNPACIFQQQRHSSN